MLVEKSKTEQELKDNINRILKKINEEENLYTEEEKEFLWQIANVLVEIKIGHKKAKELLENKNTGGEEKMLAVVEMIQRETTKAIETGRKEGIKEGIKEGRKEGRYEKKIEIAKEMLKNNMTLEMICKITHLTPKEVEKIKD
jgi:predicted transposase/invertase (TIGR01784 family)